jgi:hypothetical protein
MTRGAVEVLGRVAESEWLARVMMVVRFADAGMVVR